MNLLRIQDALKNASDDQLMQLMQSPDSTAPSYLVLTEIRRRKDMRAKQGEEPETTVAEDLSTPDQTYDEGGIRSLRTPGYEEEERIAEQQSGISGMREGGVIRMQPGGVVPRPIGELSEAELARYLDLARQRERFGVSPTAPGAPPYSVEDLMNQQAILNEIGSLDRQRINQPYLPAQQDLPGALMVPPAPPPPAASSPPAAPPPNTPAQIDPNAAASPPANNPPGGPAAAANPPAAAAAAAPAVHRAGGAGGGGGLGDLRDYIRRLEDVFPDRSAGLREELEKGRTNPAERRREAQNLALVEAGFRMMGSKNPNFLGAVGEAATPTVQSYGQQLGEIRKDERQDIRDRFELAKAETNRQWMMGQIGAAEYRTRMQELGAAQRHASSEAGANTRLQIAEANRVAAEGREETRARSTAERAAQQSLNEALRNPQLRQQVSEQIAAERPRGDRRPATEAEIRERIMGLGFRGLGASADPLGIR